MIAAHLPEIAIVGMGCRFPGAPDLFSFWENALAGAGTPSAVAHDRDERAPVAEVVAFALDDAGLSPDLLGSPRTRAFAGADGSSLLSRLQRAAQVLSSETADLAIVIDDPADTGSGTVALVFRRADEAESDGRRIYAILRDIPDATSIADLAGPPAAGMAGIVQAALSIYHGVRPNDPRAARPWIRGDASEPRRSAVSVGDGRVVLEERPVPADGDTDHPGAMLRWDSEAILLAAPDRAGLIGRMREVHAWLADHPDAALKDVACTLSLAAAERPAAVRLGLVVSSIDDLAGRLAALMPRLENPSGRAIGDGRGTYFWDEPAGESGGLAFLFPGEGSQYAGMLADLCPHFPEVRRLFDTSDRIAREQGDSVPPSETLFGRPGSDEDLWTAATAVNVVLTAQWALYRILTRLGLRPDAVAGHSSGELLAMAAAGVLDADSELERQLAGLGAVFRNLESSGEIPSARLLAVAAERDRVEAACRSIGASGVSVAIDNCPHQVVLAGPPDEIERVAVCLRAERILLEDLPFDRAYHTPAFAPVLGPVAAFFDRLDFRGPGVPIYSCATTRRMPADPAAIRDLAVSQWTRTVAFRETIEAMHADGLRVFVDVGARGNLAAFVQDTLRGRPAFAIAANLPRRGGLTQLNHLVAALFAQGVPVRPGYLYARRRPRRIDALDAARAMDPGEIEPIVDATPSLTIDFHDDESPTNPDEGRLLTAIESSIHPRPDSEPGPFPLAARFRFADDESQLPVLSEVDATMLAFQETMRAFLETQQAVIGAYLGGSGPSPMGAEPAHVVRAPAATTSGPEPGPWVGEVRRLVPGQEVEASYWLVAQDDPIAEHHTLGGRRVSALDPSLRGLPVLPFAVMAEMVAQAAALVVPAGLVLTRLAELIAHKWVRYEEEPVLLEIRGRGEPSPIPGEHRVRVGLYNRGPGGQTESPRPVFEAVAVFSSSTPAPPVAASWFLEDPRPSRFTAESLYGERWLFHGPAFQALTQVGRCSAAGIDGVLRVLPWEPLLPPGRPAHLHTDLIILDTFTHLLGCWGLDYLADRGDVIFPLRMQELELLGERPEVGTEVACRIAIAEVQRHRVRVSAEIVRPDGTVWMRLTDWEDWRFHWPGRYRDVFRHAQAVFIGEEWPLDLPGASTRAVWLEPPADMGRPVWRDVLEQTQLGPAERAGHLATGGSEDIRSRRLWGRIAAKEAARRLWHDEGHEPTYPADLAVVADERGLPVLVRLDDPGDPSMPAIAIADADGVAVAIAARDPQARPGVAVMTIAEDSLPIAGGVIPEQPEWAARIRCAVEAARQAAGAGDATGPPGAAVVRIDEPSGVVWLRSGVSAIRVYTGRRGDHAWAWTLGEGIEP